MLWVHQRPPDRAYADVDLPPKDFITERTSAEAPPGGAPLSQYWKCQLVGWSVQALVVAGIPALYSSVTWPVVVRAAIGTGVGLVLTDWLRRRMRRNAWLGLPGWKLATRLAVATVAIAAAMVLAIVPFLLMFIPPGDRTGPFVAIVLGHVAIIGIWVGIYVGVHYFRGLRSAEADRWRLELAVRDTELQALRAQVNPHFLFNSLNSLRGLVTEDPARARDVITRLAALLRYALQQSQSRTTTLDRELEMTRHYLELEALRFEARLTYRIEVDPRALEHMIPPMLVQTIVENAIRHGIAQLPEGGTVTIEARKPADVLHIRVTNTGTLNGRESHRGIGLANSLDRLRLIFGDEARLSLSPSGPNEVACEISVPPPRWSLPVER